MTIIFDGKKLAKIKEKKLAGEVAEFRRKYEGAPKLVSIMVGDNPPSELYLRLKQKAAEKVGINFEKKKFPATVKVEELICFIKKLNEDKSVNGVMVQMPLPKSLEIGNARKAGFLRNGKLEILGAITPQKDVDCLTPENLGLLMMGKPRFLPATVKAVLEIITYASSRGVNRVPPPACQHQHVCIVGASNIVGKPLALHLSNLGATVTICRSKTKNLGEYTKQAEILVSATGVPNLIKKEMVKKGAVVIDVGSPKGDVGFDNVAKVASFITPVPGGVGPMTVVCLLENLLEFPSRKLLYEDP